MRNYLDEYLSRAKALENCTDTRGKQLTELTEGACVSSVSPPTVEYPKKSEAQAECVEWSEIIIPESLAIDITTRCYNGGCPAIVTFKQGRGCCSRCGVVQRIVE